MNASGDSDILKKSKKIALLNHRTSKGDTLNANATICDHFNLALLQSKKIKCRCCLNAKLKYFPKVQPWWLGRSLSSRRLGFSSSLAFDPYPHFQWTPRATVKLLTTHPGNNKLICRVQNPNIPRAGRGRAAHGGAAGAGGAGQDGTPTGRVAQETTDPLAPQGIGDNRPECFFGSMNNRNPM